MALSKIESQALDVGQIGGRRNLIINGHPIVDQRQEGTSISSDGYVCDRWYIQAVSEDQLAFTADQDTTAPDGFSNSLRVQTSTAETTVDANDLFRWIYKVEAQDLQMLSYGSSVAKSFTLSFYVRSSLTGTYALNFYTPDSDRNITKTYTINAADTWERKTITVEGDTAGSGIANDNGEGLQINWILMAGSDYTSVDSTSWGTNADNRRAYNHTAEFGTNTSHTWYLTGVQLEVSTVASPFEHRSFSEELTLCRRYFRRGRIFNGHNVTSSTRAYTWETLHPVMNSDPTLTIDSIGSNGSSHSGQESSLVGLNHGSAVPDGGNGIRAMVQSSNSQSDWWYSMQYSADAEL
mgnify:CR=1 FL=1